MPYYYAYEVDDDGHVLSRFNVYAEDDGAAVVKIKPRLANRDIEIWCFDRKIALLKSADSVQR